MKTRKQINHDYYTSEWGRAVHLLKSAKRRCKTKSLEITLTKEWVYEKVKNGKCELTGLPFDLTYSENLNNPFSPSLDRIDITKGYTAENTRVILWVANTAINEFGLDKVKHVFKILGEL